MSADSRMQRRRVGWFSSKDAGMAVQCNEGTIREKRAVLSLSANGKRSSGNILRV